MEKQLGRFEPEIYAAFRIVVGFLFLCHGLQKLFGWLGGVQGSGAPADAPLIVVAGVIELVGGALVAVGFLASWAAFICSGQMAVAYFLAHQAQGPLPIQNKGELAALYSFAFLLIAARGAGKFALGK
jgi:putative oxidoreductase